MNRFALLFLSITAGILGYATMHKSTASWVGRASVAEEQWQTCSNALAELERQRASLQADVARSKRELENVPQVIRENPDLSKFLTEVLPSNHEHAAADTRTVAALTKLRQEIAIGWNASPDYVLVSKRTLPQIDFCLTSGSKASSAAAEILQLSDEEQAEIVKAVQHVHDAAAAPTLERKEPHDDVLAEYTAYAMDTGTEQTLSNRFSAEITTFLDPERANLFVPSAWRDIRAGLSPWTDETLTIRRVSDGESDVIWEVTRQGQQIANGKVRYAQLPTQAFLKLLNVGWEGFAKQEGFDLPPRFHSQPY